MKQVKFEIIPHFHHIIDGFSYVLTKNDQLPVGLIAQFVEHCTGIAEVIASHNFSSPRSVLSKIGRILTLFYSIIFVEIHLNVGCCSVFRLIFALICGRCKDFCSTSKFLYRLMNGMVTILHAQ